MITHAGSTAPPQLRVTGPDPTLLTPPGGGAARPAWSSLDPSPWSAPVPRADSHLPPQLGPASRVLLVAAHGGCGTTTLAQHLPAAREVGLLVLLSWAADASAPAGVRVCAVAAATPDGTSQAGACLHRLHAAGYRAEALHLALVSDGRGPVPVAVRARTRLLHPAVAATHLLPHVQRWRYEDRSARTPSRRYARAAETLWAALSGHSSSTARAGAAAQDAARTPHPSPTAAPNPPAFHGVPAHSAAGISAGFAGQGRRW